MSNFEKSTKINRNKNGKEIERVMDIKPKNAKLKLTLDEVNNLYKKIAERADTSNIMIKAMTIDGYKTLKSFDYNDEDLIHCLDDYYSSLPKEKRDKFENLLSVQIITRM